MGGEKVKNSEKIEVKICPICGEEQSIDRFRYGYPAINQSAICVSCIDKMAQRLDAFIRIDKALCKELRLNYGRVTDYEAYLRKTGRFHREDEFNYVTDQCVKCRHRKGAEGVTEEKTHG